MIISTVSTLISALTSRGAMTADFTVPPFR
jgi:hypothetical protein